MSDTIGIPFLAAEGSAVRCVNRQTKKEVGVVVTAWAPVGNATREWTALIYDEHSMTLRPITELYDPIPRI